MEQTLRRDLAWGPLAGACAALIAFFPWMALPLAVVPIAWWMLCGANRWVIAFLLAALLLPPLPLPGGDAGPHPAIAFAAIGLWAGLARLQTWRIRPDFLSGALFLFAGALMMSVPLAAVYSGPAIALGSLARVGLFAITVYLFFYVSQGPGRTLPPERLVRLLFWAGLASGVFACVDFYFQLPAPSRFAEQFVWLPSGVFRRAQGIFYEASTLGSFCVFLLVMIASIASLRLTDRLGLRGAWLAVAAGVLFAALMFSFSRGAVVSLIVAIAALGWLERGRLRAWTGRNASLLIAAVVGAPSLVYALFPEFLTAYLDRISAVGEYLGSAPNLILSRRLESWQFLLESLREHPWQMVLGIGYKTLPYSQYLGQPLVADNMYLSLLVETGWPGLAALLALNVAILFTTYRWATGTGSEWRRLAGTWMFAFWCGQTVQMASGDILTYWRILPVFFAVLAMGARDDDPAP